MTVAVDIGGTSMRVARWETDDPNDLSVVSTIATPTDIGQIPSLLCDAIGGFAGVTEIGVGCAGLVDPVGGITRWMPHAGGRDTAIGPILHDRFGVPVVVDNDANLAGLAEARLGAGIGKRVVLLVTVGTGIGAGLVIGGEIERGRGGLGEVGHMRVADGPGCVCGEIGCWEALASGRVIDAAGRRVLGSTASAVDLVNAANTDLRARDVLDEIGTWLGVGLANLISIIDPEVVVLGGGALQAGDALLVPATRYLETRSGGIAVAGIPPVVPASFGPSAGLVGAGLVAREVRK